MMSILTVLIFVGGEALATSYLCDLTQTEVEDILDDYGATATFQELSPYILDPFDCGTFGDLCNLVGPARAQEFVCARWDQARDGDTIAAMQATGDEHLDELIDEWFDARFSPSVGIGGGHPWWGVDLIDYTSPSCGSDSGYKEETDGDGRRHRVKGDAWKVNLGWIYRSIGATFYVKSEVMIMGAGTGVYKRNYTGVLDIDADFTSLTPLCSETKTGGKTDGRIGRNVTHAMTNSQKPYESVLATVSSSVGSVVFDDLTVCINAPWDDPCSH